MQLYCDAAVLLVYNGCYTAGVAAPGATRSSTKWREVDYEWLGAHPDEVATSLFKQGQNQPNAIPHKLSEVRAAE
jgi:hypothetical protein